MHIGTYSLLLLGTLPPLCEHNPRPASWKMRDHRKKTLVIPTILAEAPRYMIEAIVNHPVPTELAQTRTEQPTLRIMRNNVCCFKPLNLNEFVSQQKTIDIAV